jgi:2-keto-myo-inositol isomerase
MPDRRGPEYDRMDFALNQKTVSRLGYAAFLDLALELGCVGVEPRNDLGRPFFNEMRPKPESAACNRSVDVASA